MPLNNQPLASPEALSLLRTQVDEGRGLHEQNMQTVEQLQSKLFAGEMTQQEYDQAIGGLFDSELANLQGDLAEQGRPGEAGGIPVGIGQLAGVAQRRFEAKLYGQTNARQGPMMSPPGGDQQISQQPTGTDELLYGQTSRPDEAANTGINRIVPGRNPMPTGLKGSLPELVRMARSPDAPPQLLMLVQLLAHYAEK